MDMKPMPKAHETKKESSLSSPLLLLFLVAMLVRGAVLFASLDSFNTDPDSYLKLAENWYSYGVLGNHNTPTAFRPPLYPAALKELVSIRASSERPDVYHAPFTEETGKKRLVRRQESQSSDPVSDFFDQNVALSRNASIALFHWILGVSTVILVWFYARYAGLSPLLALFAGLLVTFDPILLQQSRLIMTETFAAFFAALLLLSTVTVVKRRNSVFSCVGYAFLGALFGLSTLCRPAFYAFAGLVFINLFFVELADLIYKARENKTGNVSRFCGGFFRLVCFLSMCALVVSPWAVRNDRVFGKPILTTTHGGYTLYLANNPELYAHYQTSSPFSLWDPEPFHTRRQKDYDVALADNNITKGSADEELFQDDWTRGQAIETIRSNRPTFFYSCAIRFCELWRFLPHDVSQFEETSRSRSEKTIAGVPLGDFRNYGRYFVAVFYIVEFILAIVGILALSLKKTGNFKNNSSGSVFESPLIWGFLLILSVQAPHLLYWTNMRMRAPLEVFIPILALLSVTIFRKNRPHVAP